MTKVAGDGVALLYGCIIMLTLAWVFAMLRLGVRKWKNNFGLDDWLMFAGLALYSVTVGLVIRCCFYGAGQKSKNLEPYDMMMGTKVGSLSADTTFSVLTTWPALFCCSILLLRLLGPDQDKHLRNDASNLRFPPSFCLYNQGNHRRDHLDRHRVHHCCRQRLPPD